MPHDVSAPAVPFEVAGPDRPGLVGQAVLKLLTQRATIAAVRTLTPHFRRVSLRSEAFRTAVRVPGDKMQVRVAGMSFRTFTPFRLDGDDDVLEILGYLHGGAPGAAWLANAAAHQACQVRGPRRSMDLPAIRRSTVFFGDESSLALALSLCNTALGGLDTHFIVEAADPPEMRAALDAFGRSELRNVRIVARLPGDAHLEEVESALMRFAIADQYRQYVLSGKSTSIQRLNRSLRAAGAKQSQMLVKAYWAPGKAGLD